MKFVRSFIFSIIATMILLLTACGGGNNKNPQIDGVTGPNVSMVNGMIVTSMVFQNIVIDGGATIPIPKYPNSSFQIGPDFQSSGTLLSLSLSVEDFLGNQGVGLDPQTLPGGRLLPGVVGGALPAIAVAIPNLNNSVLYVGPEVIGLFVPFEKLDLSGAIITFRFFNSERNPVGNISLVGSDANEKNAGILLLMDPSLLGIHGEEARLAKLKHYIELGYH